MDNFQTKRRTKDNIRENLTTKIETKSHIFDLEPSNSQIVHDFNESTDDGHQDVVRPDTKDSIERNINKDRYGFGDFDESQHVPGCPLKWFYDKKLSEKKKTRSAYRYRGYKSIGDLETVRNKRNRLSRGRTPVDVKIHKINLVDKYSKNRVKNSSGSRSDKTLKKRNDVVDKIDKRNLAAKLNWKLHDVSSDDDSFCEPVSELSFRQNYLPPRPLPGTKTFLTILLFPNRESKCCVPKHHVRLDSTKGGDMAFPKLSVKTLDLPVLTSSEQMHNSKVVQPFRSRCGSSSNVFKKHQIPSQVTINLKETKIEGNRRSYVPISAKRLNKNKSKDENSLETLVCHLNGKSDCSKETEKLFENVISNITVEDKEELKQFYERKTSATTIEHLHKKLKALHINLSEMYLTCGKVRIFEKPSKKRK